MKKNIIFLFCFIVFIFPTRAENTIFNSFCEYTLENECKVFVLEDFSIPHVRIELSIKSGFSSQRKDASRPGSKERMDSRHRLRQGRSSVHGASWHDRICECL